MGFANCVECDSLAAAALLHDSLPSEAQKMKRLLMILLLGALGYGPDKTEDVVALEELGAQILRDDHQDEIRIVDFTNTRVTDAGLVHLKGLTKLGYLHLDHTRITGARLAVAVMVLSGACPTLTAGPPNLVANSGLETADPEHTARPRGFRTGRVGKSFSEMTWTSPGHNSRRCVSVTTKDSSGLGYWQTLVTVKPHTTYTISLDYRARAADRGEKSDVPFFQRSRPGGPNIELGMLPADPTDAGRPTAWSDIGIALDPVGGIFLPLATEWSRFVHSFKTRSGQTRLVVKLRLCHYAQQVWFDNLSVVEGKSPATTIAVDPLWATGDTTPPSVFRPLPLPNTKAASDAVIQVMFSEDGTGVDPTTARVLLDGKNVTSRAVINVTGLRLSPARPLAEGPHRVSVSIADRSGVRSNTLTWQFGVGRTLRNMLVAEPGSTRLNGEPFFPIGIYAYSCHPGDGRFRADHLRQAADAGFNIVFNTIETRQGLDTDLAHGIMGTLNITSGLKHCTDPAAAEMALLKKGQGRLADHPGVVAFWADDPENVEDSKATPISATAIAKMRNARVALKKGFPRIPSVFAISNLPRLKPAMPYGDILLSYRYSVPQYHPMTINSFTIGTCRKLVPDKPLWFLSQAVDLGYGARFKLSRPMRPTPNEVRAMAFYSLACGVHGYALYANFLNARDFPDHWATALNVARRVRHIAGPLTAGHDVGTARLAPGPFTGSVFFRELRHGDRHILIAVNMSAGTLPVTWHFEKPVQATVLFEDRRMVKPAVTVGDVFGPWSVHLYQW